MAERHLEGADWSAVDQARLARHEQLLAIWRDLPAEELLVDLTVLAQLAAFTQRQELERLKAAR